MPDQPELSDAESAILQVVHAEGSVDLYALARTVGIGPRSVQETIQQLAAKDLVIVSDRGVQVHCTPVGEEVARAEQARS